MQRLIIERLGTLRDLKSNRIKFEFWCQSSAELTLLAKTIGTASKSFIEAFLSITRGSDDFANIIMANWIDEPISNPSNRFAALFEWEKITLKKQ